MTVAALVSASEPDGAAPINLFDTPMPSAMPRPLGAACLYMGIPEVLVVDNNPGFHNNAFRQLAVTLGIQVHIAPMGLPGKRRSTVATYLQHWLAANGQVVNTGEGLMDAVQVRLAHQDADSVRGDLRTPLKKWEEGVARYPIRLPSAAFTPSRIDIGHGPEGG
jgi:hypothetical protein